MLTIRSDLSKNDVSHIKATIDQRLYASELESHVPSKQLIDGFANYHDLSIWCVTGNLVEAGFSYEVTFVATDKGKAWLVEFYRRMVELAVSSGMVELDGKRSIENFLSLSRTFMEIKVPGQPQSCLTEVMSLRWCYQDHYEHRDRAEFIVSGLKHMSYKVH